jgi:hypothetical protein
MRTSKQSLNEEILRMHQIMGIKENIMLYEAPVANIEVPKLKLYKVANNLMNNPQIYFPTSLVDEINKFNKSKFTLS